MSQPISTGPKSDPTAARPLRGADAGGMDQGFRVLSSLIAGVLIYGGLGWLGDYALHTRSLVAVGVVLGAGLGVYTTIRRLLRRPAGEATEGAR